MAYDAFISYSHAADGRLAPAIQLGLQRLARPWYRARSLRVFRDDTGLAVNPHLWISIQQALDESEYFVLLASPEAAASPWVNREIEHWTAHKPPDRLLPVLTDGTLFWDAARGNYNLDLSDALPPALAGGFPAEPRHLDLRWARDETELDLRHGRFRDAIADLAAPMHHLPKDELESQDVRQHRRALRLARTAMVTLVALLISAIVGGGLAVRNAARARDETGKARAQATTNLSRGLAASAVNAFAQDRVELGLLLAVEAVKTQPSLTARSSLLAGLLTRPTLARYLYGVHTLPKGVAFSPDGRFLAVTSADGLILWDVASGRTLPLQTTSPLVGLLAFAPDSRVLAVATPTGITLVDIVSGQMRPVRFETRSNEYFNPASALAFSPDGRLLAATGSFNNPTNSASIRVWQTADGHLLQSMANEGGLVAFDPSGSLLAAVDGGQVTVWDAAKNWAVTSRFNARMLAPNSNTAWLPLRVGFSADGKTITSSMGEARGLPTTYTTFSWDLTSGKEYPPIKTTPAAIQTGGNTVVVAISPDLHMLAARSDSDGLVTLFNSASGSAQSGPMPAAIVPPVTADEGRLLQTVAFSPDGTLLAIASDDGTVRLWQTKSSGPRVAQHVGHIDVSEGVTAGLSADGAILAIGDNLSGRLTVLDAVSGNPLVHQPPSLPEAALSPLPFGALFTLSPSGRTLLSGDFLSGPTITGSDFTDGHFNRIPTLWIWSTDSGTRTSLSSDALRGCSGAVVAFSADDRQLAIGCSGALNVWDLRTRQVRHWPVASRPDALGFSPGGRTLVMDGTADSTNEHQISLWDVSSGHSLGHPLRHNSASCALAFSPDGHQVAAADSTSITFLDARTATPNGKQVASSEHCQVTFTPDGALLASGAAGSGPSGVSLWTAESGQPFGRVLPAGTDDQLLSLAWTRSGPPTLVSVVQHRARVLPQGPAQIAPVEVVRWSFDVKSWVRDACQIANRDLTRSEWGIFVGGSAPYRRTCTDQRD
jgi:WD40 repeat protein